MAKILAFAGSARKASFNKKLVALAAAAAQQAGAQVTLIDMADYPMPLFDEDLEASEGMPASARAFKQLLADHQGFLIASPEYNSAFSPLLKNALDWASRPVSQEAPGVNPYRGKYASIMATSPGALGGMRGLVFVRMLLGNLGMTVLPDQLAVPNAFEAFAEDGALVDAALQAKVQGLGASLSAELGKR
ncbi:MAG: NAD(P)H-dependent oxidoreductase [Cellvibrionaceae bacterium]|nr:NAD(P)H-dependent oxidoreductase [Cellvibrionaceae bacterium]